MDLEGILLWIFLDFAVVSSAPPNSWTDGKRSFWIRWFESVQLPTIPGQRNRRHDLKHRPSMYGITEMSGSVIKSEGNDIKHYGSVGILVPNVEAKVVDIVTGKPLPPNRRGELCFRGPMVMKEYYKNKEATSSATDSEGWLHSGDICRINEEGHVYIVDRLKELIKYKGLQIAPAELEELLLCNPQIEDSAVIPYRDEEAGEVPMAFIARKPQSNLTEEDVIKFIGRQVAPYKKIRRVAFVVSIPRTESGKILRKHLRALVEQKTSIPSKL